MQALKTTFTWRISITTTSHQLQEIPNLVFLVHSWQCTLKPRSWAIHRRKKLIIFPTPTPPQKKKTHRRKTWMIFLPTGGLVHHTKWYTCVHNTEKANNFFSAKTYPGLQYPMDPIIHDGHHRLSPRNQPEIIAWRSSFRMKKRFRRLRFSWVPKRRPIGMSIRSKRNISCGHGMAL